MTKLTAPEGTQTSSSRATTNLLVSVRSVQEARIAIASAVEIIDLKEPNGGALAPASPEVWDEVSRLIAPPEHSRLKLSLALGESETAIELADRVPPTARFAKAGPSGLGDATELSQLWKQLRERLPPAVTLVAVAYADSDFATTIPPEQVMSLASQNGIRHVLIDTFGKQAGSSVDLLGTARLESLAIEARKKNIWWALAGSLRLTDAEMLLRSAAAPNCFAIRGAVCEGDRRGGLAADRLARWTELLRGRC
ncbi:(5-formylfuran-3-yl)methyl phosphate synthase [Rhodopirellula sp. MGV]|uniref:(5-formylfuran-3-yl)methyl phosphate synthase n=1 Tax=Rhodopirellula sp. MGV TaxID=2023130 RepID=UPI0013041F13|nr:(5-formylfuran-3-yl)methyl phosphate synthase [Rhodopirellula sp. MGV]